MCCGKSLFKDNNGLDSQDSGKYLKFYQGDLVGVDGSQIVDKALLSGIQIPYLQLMKTRICLSAGQTDYAITYPQFGDNATFVMVVPEYDPRSRAERDNYILYYYKGDSTRKYPIDELMIQTGNSTNRIKQIYISNPNLKYTVCMQVVIAVVDNTNNVFSKEELTETNSITYRDLTYQNIETWVPGESLVIRNSAGAPVAFLQLGTITGVEKSGRIVIISDTAYGVIQLEFKTNYDAQQALSLIAWVLEDKTRIIQSLNPNKSDNITPQVNFTNNVFLDSGLTSTPPSNSTQASVFYATPIVLAQYNNFMVKKSLLTYLITNVIDNRDGYITMNDNNIVITNSSGVSVDYITTPGNYIITLTIDDIANNIITPNITINITVA